MASPSHGAREEDFGDADRGSFQWTKQWYPLAVVAHLDPAKPHAVPLLGRDLVLWCAGDGDWRCFEDACPTAGSPFPKGVSSPMAPCCAPTTPGGSTLPAVACSIPQSIDAATKSPGTAPLEGLCPGLPHPATPGPAVGVGRRWAGRAGMPATGTLPDPGAGRRSRSRRPPELEPAGSSLGSDFFIENVPIRPMYRSPVSRTGGQSPTPMPATTTWSDAGHRHQARVLHSPSGPRLPHQQEQFAGFPLPCLMRIATSGGPSHRSSRAAIDTPTGWCRRIGHRDPEPPSRRSPGPGLLRPAPAHIAAPCAS